MSDRIPDMLIQVIHEETMERALGAAGAVHPGADAVEFRVDPLAECDIPALVCRSRAPVIVTCRSPEQGGAFRGAPAERRRRLLAAAAAGATWVDLEFGGPDEELIGQTGSTRVILSTHLPESQPGVLEDLYRRMAARPGVEVLKIVPFADSLTDNLGVRDLLRRARGDGRPLAAFCSGRRGAVSRILALRWGSWATYGAGERGRESAAGQLTLADLHDGYGVKAIGRETRLFGILGFPLGHSLSPLVHNHAFRAAGIDACYLPFETETLAEFLPLLRDLPVAGFGVTLPHKEAIRLHLDAVEEADRPLGSVNTVVRRWNRLVGSNTDLPAAMRVLERVTPIRGRRVALIGAGGAARAVARGLIDRGARLTIYNRTAARAVALAADVGAEGAALDAFGREPCDILIHATPVGMHPAIDAIPVPPDSMRAGVVFDLVYNPPETRLLREARGRGARTVSGLEMFLEQAFDQFRRFTGLPAPEAVIRQAAERALGIGPAPGAGDA